MQQKNLQITGSIFALLLILLLAAKKRFFLVNLLKLQGDTIPWYYVKLSCSDRGRWAEVWQGAPFCFGVELRVYAVLCIAALCFLGVLVLSLRKNMK